MQKGIVNFAFALFAALMLVGSTFAAVNPNGNVPVTGNNLPPVISLVGGPTSILVNQAGTWSVSAHDPDGTYLAYSVNWGEGNGAIEMAPVAAGSTATFQHTYAQVGTYTITFTVNDAQGASTQATLTTVVTTTTQTNQPPVITGVSGPASLNINQAGVWAVSAYDPDGTYLAYSVVWGDDGAKSASSSSTATFQHTYTQAGTYAIRFTVTDDKGAQAQSVATVVVGNDTTPKCTDTDGGVDIYVKGKTTGATAPGGQVITESDICGSNMVTEYYCKSDGYMSLWVIPCQSGYQCGDGACVKSGSSNLPPVITNVGGPTSIGAGQAGAWTVSAYDPDGTYLAYSVNWGEGNDGQHLAPSQQQTGSTATFQHTYSQAGTYTITFTATDSAGASTQSTLTVNVGGTTTYTYTCTDSDGGMNLYVKGNVVITRTSPPNPGVWSNFTDYCLDNGQLGEYTCLGSNGVAGFTKNTCPSGYTCSDGACVQQTHTNRPPVITGVAGPSSLSTGEDGFWNASAYDPDGNYLTWGIDWGEGQGTANGGQTNAGSAAAFSHTYLNAGTYTITFTATDSAGATTQSTLTVNVGGGIAPSTQKIALNFQKGWNLVSVPITGSITPEQIAQKCDISTTVWHYEPGQGKYVPVTPLGGGALGYWIKANSACTYELEQPYAMENSFHVLAGWNMIGAPGTSAQFADYIGNCEVLSGPWSYSPSAGQYAQSSMLEPGKGYWVKVASECTLGANNPPGTPSG